MNPAAPSPSADVMWTADPMEALRRIEALGGSAAYIARECLRRQPAPAAAVGGVPDGWRLVPIEPTWDMRNEGREFLIDGLEKEPEKLAYFLWKTMVAAAPEAK